MQATFDPPWDFTGVWTMTGGDFPRHQLVAEPACCPEDVDADGTVGLSDLLAILSRWGSSDQAADVDGDGNVALGDLLLVLAAWGPR